MLIAPSVQVSGTRYKLAIVVFRSNPPHRGHFHVIEEARKHSDFVLVLQGSSNVARNSRNPFTPSERSDLLASAGYDASRNVITSPLPDFIYQDNAWENEVHRQVYEVWDSLYPNLSFDRTSVALCGHSKDQTSYYLKKFPGWASINVPDPVRHLHDNTMMSSTDIRSVLFDGENSWNYIEDRLSAFMPESTFECLYELLRSSECHFRKRKTFELCLEEFAFVKDYKAKYKYVGANHPVTFVTTDAVVTQSGYILLGTRKDNPGRGLLCLPGGFLKHNIGFYENSLLELREETRLRVSRDTLHKSLKGSHMFDDVNRSLRGRTVTMAYHFQLPEADKLPKVVGSDDLSHAAWYPISAVDPTTMYEDHYFIRNYFTS